MSEAENVKIDFDELKREKRKNFKERIWFIKYWVEYMKTHSDAEWSEGQKKLIDAQFSSGKEEE